MSPTPLPRTITIAGVKERYGWGRSTIYRLLGEEKLRAVKLGPRLLIFVDSCEALLAGLPAAKIRPSKPPKPWKRPPRIPSPPAAAGIARVPGTVSALRTPPRTPDEAA
jgi:predicted DNA-binding transcriptional regulator AlpA